MKPSTPIETEMMFLRDIDRRLASIEFDLKCGNNIKAWEVGGIRNALNARIATVTKLRDEENANAQVPEQAQGHHSGADPRGQQG